jgi:signal peptidase II
MRILALTACITFALDQATKWAVVHGLNLIERGDIDVFPPYLTFRMAWNTGINFGLLSGSANFTRWLLIAVALAISVWVIIWIRRERAGKLAHISAGLLIGGAIGNVIDRLWYGAVADFLNMSCCGIDNPYAFNVADIAIFAGAIGLVLFTGQPAKRKRTKTP